MMEFLKQASSFSEHVVAITQQFKQSYVWSDKDKSRLAMYATDALAGISEVNQTYLVFALREAFIRNARRESSVLAGARFLGQSLHRKIGSSVTASLRNTASYTKSIPAFSQFTIGNLDFYNVESVNIPSNQNRELMLRQGSIRVKSFDLAQIDLTFPEIRLGEPGFVVSEQDVLVYVENKVSLERRAFEPLTETIFHATDDNIFIPSTTEDGDFSMLFGDGNFGNRLNPNDRLVVRYVITAGASSNIGSPGIRVRLVGDEDFTGQTTEPALGGSNEQDADTLKMYSPYIMESHGNLIRQDHWTGNIGNYPDVADVVVQGQREIDPDDPAWMNVVRVCILPKNSSSWGGTNPNPISAQWNRFMAWAEVRKPKYIVIQKFNPEKLLVDIVLEAYIQEGQSRVEWQSRIEKSIVDYFTRQRGMLGRKLEPSDLDDLIKYDGDGNRYPGLDYVRIKSPTKAVEPSSKLEYVTPRTVSVVVKYSDRKER